MVKRQVGLSIKLLKYLNYQLSIINYQLSIINFKTLR